MKNYVSFFLLFSLCGLSQNYYLRIESPSVLEKKIIDSLNYSSKLPSVKKIIEEQQAFQNKLLLAGFLEAEISKQEKTNDSTFVFTYSLGTQTKNILVQCNDLSTFDKNLLEIDTNVKLLLSEVENYLNTKLNLLEKKGYAQAKLKLINFKIQQASLEANLYLELNAIRKINKLVVSGYSDFPKGVKRLYEKKYAGKTFNQETIKTIYKDFNSLPFVNQPKYPEVLLTKDSTDIYIYLEKRKNNSFDGFIGFGTNEAKQKLQFNGYLDLNLYNNLNKGERFNLYWKNDGNKQSTFNAKLELAYLFQLPLAFKGNLKIFRQDTIFQQSSFDADLGYMFSYNTKAYIGVKESTSEAIQKNPNATLKDLTSNFITTSISHQKLNYDNEVFPEVFSMNIKMGIGSRKIGLDKTNQFFSQLQANYLLEVNKKNYIHLKTDTYYLQSTTYYTNELYRFGGIQSIRGFNENSLQGNLFTGVFTEYRYIVASNLYVHTLTDFGYFQDKANQTSANLYGFGFGLGLLNKSGIFNLVYANGSSSGQTFKLSNSIVQVSLKTTF
ncbi:MAG: hypothetical protein RLY43_518 [Bacteroidota bacterium]